MKADRRASEEGLHVIDSYGTLLLLAGFSVWITVDIILLIRKHLGNQHDEDEQDKEDG